MWWKYKECENSMRNVKTVWRMWGTDEKYKECKNNMKNVLKKCDKRMKYVRNVQKM